MASRPAWETLWASYIYPGYSSVCFPFSPLHLSCWCLPLPFLARPSSQPLWGCSGLSNIAHATAARSLPCRFHSPWKHLSTCLYLWLLFYQPEITMRVGLYPDPNEYISRISGNGDIFDFWKLLNYTTKHSPIMPNYKADITGGIRFGTRNRHSFKNLLLK